MSSRMDASEKKRKAHENDDQGTYYSAKEKITFYIIINVSCRHNFYISFYERG